ncbi:hypothetical protein OEZ85_009575 [Tetradesmus obliquus]|uniref:Uncharacterized protein n=1 Tax=Tetradesmus obliquus TaxID=3088 RepID=A0ABY8U9E1_TETOB|nr:hypothetical protein OEZ85_009575 [Tetradesmus obliquus]
MVGVRKCSTRTNAIQIAEHAAYVSEVAVVSCPKRLPTLLKVLEAQGHSLLSPSDRAGLHPLVIPLSTFEEPAAGKRSGRGVLGLLRWPQPNQHKAMPLPLVSMSREGRSLTLLARSVDEYLHRLLAEEDVAAGPGPISAAAGDDGAELYTAGGVEAAGFDAAKFNLYLVRKVGMFPDVCEALSLGHLARGDATSAMVASEWYMRNNHFPGWGRPYEFASELFQKIGKRGEEARDMARYSLRNPWWSLAHFDATRAVSELQGDATQVHWQLSAEATEASTSQVTGFQYKEPRTEQEIALDAAGKLMDLVAAGEGGGSYGAIAQQLAEEYQKAGLSDVANFIKASS